MRRIAYEKMVHRGRVILIGVLLIMVMTSYFSFVAVKEKFLEKQKVVIGQLYTIDADASAKMVRLLFETEVTEASIQAGEQAFYELGYTKQGDSYLEEKMSFSALGKGLFMLEIFQAMLILLGWYIMIKLQSDYKKSLTHRIKEAVEHVKPFEVQAVLLSDRILEERIEELLYLQQVTKEYLNSKNKQMQEFIENVAHQIKTPLSCISISLDLLETQVKEGNAGEKIESCFTHLATIQALLKRLMDIGRLEAGKIIFRKEMLQIEELLQDCILSIPQQEHEIRLFMEDNHTKENHGKENYGEYHGDYEWLKEAFTNLIKNSVEHVPKDTPIDVTMLKMKEMISICIRDYGPGFHAEDLPYIFDRFYNASYSKSNHTGIGMNLSKLIIEGHHGKIRAENHEEGGAVIVIQLPLYKLKR